MHMVFGTLFIIFMLMHDIKLWIYAIPGEQCCSRQRSGLHQREIAIGAQSVLRVMPGWGDCGLSLTVACVTTTACMTGPSFAAGMLFYLLDLQLRLVQRSQPVQLRTLTTAGHEGLVALQLHADSRWPMRPVQASFCPQMLMQRQPLSQRQQFHDEVRLTYDAGGQGGVTFTQKHSWMIPERLLGKACGSPMCLMFGRSERRLTADELSAGALHTGCSSLSHAVAPLHCDTWGAAPHLRCTCEDSWELDTGLHKQVDSHLYISRSLMTI